MSYEPKEWVSGEVITADKLNNIEEGVQEALECCGSGGDCGYSCTETKELILETNITTVNVDDVISGNYDASIGYNETIIVTFDGVEYTCQIFDGSSYGAPYDFDTESFDWSEYPFSIYSDEYYTSFFTPSAGTYSVKIETPSEIVETSECFEKAVNHIVPPSLKNLVDGQTRASVRGVLSAEEDSNYTLGIGAFATGIQTKASGTYAHAEGNGSIASGNNSHAEGSGRASGNNSHAEGSGTASGEYSHAEGTGTTASNREAHAEGAATTASGISSHAEGAQTTASGSNSHAEGSSAVASGRHSHAQNNSTIAQAESQTAIGKYNVAQGDPRYDSISTDYVLIIGNGTSANARSNALAIKFDGTFVFANGTEITPAQFASLLALL